MKIKKLKSFELDEPIKVFLMKERQLIDLKSRVKDINNAEIGQQKSKLSKSMGKKAKNQHGYKELKRKKKL